MKLIFVYNANTDPLSAISDYAHKVFSPSTYKCDLCALTHHNLGQRSSWKTFRENTEANMKFLYIRQFEREFNFSPEYPVILESRKGELIPVLDKYKLAEIESIDELIKALTSYIALNE